ARPSGSRPSSERRRSSTPSSWHRCPQAAGTVGPRRYNRMVPTSARCWVNTVSLDHVRRAVEGGFTQADHGSRTGLTRLRSGDGLVFYSPRTAFHDGQPLQQFTAVGVV